MAYGKSRFGFEDLEAYKVASQVRRDIYALVKNLPGEEKYALGQQMRRAAASLTNNIAEGYGRFHWQETIQFCRHSRGSLAELVDDLHICHEQGYAEPEALAAIRALCENLLRLLNGYINYLQRNKHGSNETNNP